MFVWMVEYHINGKWFPKCMCMTRKNARQIAAIGSCPQRVVKYSRSGR